MNRIDRISAILIHLQSRKVVKAQDIADRFGISLRTVYRDIRTLEEAGIPLSGEAGVGYSIMDGYRLPPVMFTNDEASAMLTAGKMVEKLTDNSTRESYQSAMYKIRSVLKNTEKDYLEGIETQIEVMANPYLPNSQAETTHLQKILKCISSKKLMALSYFSNHSQESSSRKIEPVGIFYLGNHWYLIAFCRLRNDYRHFRIDRIEKVAESGESFAKQHPALKSFITQISQEKELYQVRIHIPRTALRYFGDQKYYNGFVSETLIGDKAEMNFLCASLEGFARWYMMYGEIAEIKEPESLKLLVRKLATAIASK